MLDSTSHAHHVSRNCALTQVVICLKAQSGWMPVGQLYESPFTEFSPRGVDGVFNPEQVGQMMGVLEHIRMSASG